MIICCQSSPSIAQKQERVKIFKTTLGEAIADFSKNNSFILSQKIGIYYDTIFYGPSPYIYDVPNVKIFDSKCILLVNNGLTVDFIVYEKLEKKWVLVGSRQLLMIDLPGKQEIKIINGTSSGVYAGQTCPRIFIDYEKNEFKLVDYYKK